MADMQQVTVIGRDAKFKGELTFDSSLKVLGLLEGVIRAGGEVTIGDGGLIKGDVEANTIVVEGTVEGDLIAKNKLHLTAKARVIGDVTAASLTVAEGATFIGHCRVGSEAIAKAMSETREMEAASIETKPVMKPISVGGKPAMPALNIPPMPSLAGIGIGAANGASNGTPAPGSGWLSA